MKVSKTSRPVASAFQASVHTELKCYGNQPVGVCQPHYWVDQWDQELVSQGLQIGDQQQAALAQFIPFLICGEQSAVALFSREQHPPSTLSKLIDTFGHIERDEASHEAAWQRLFSMLPTPADLTRLKRRGAAFFARLGRAGSAAEHFARVAHLDRAVGIMMWHLEHSEAGRDQVVRRLAARIKRDEARHTTVSKKYAHALGIDRTAFADLGAGLRADLVTLLTPSGDALEILGVDPDALLSRLAAGSAV